MKRISKIVSILIIVCIAVVLLCACEDTPTPVIPTLDAPANVAVSGTALITWDAVANATSYTVTVAGTPHEVQVPYYQVTATNVDFKASVVAHADGYQDSAASATVTFVAVIVPPIPVTTIEVAVSGKGRVNPGTTSEYHATVTGTDEKEVSWSLGKAVDGVSIDPITGILTVEEGVAGGNGILEIVATSLMDGESSGSKVVSIASQPTLTQAMLDELANADKVRFDGYVNIALYETGISDKYVRTYTVTVKTALDGTNWYAEYENEETGLVSRLYCKNDNGIASTVSVSFTNEEEFYPMLNDNGAELTFEESGLYNNFRGLKVSDFRWNNDTWSYQYIGLDLNLPQRMVSSANPYDFKANTLSLIVQDGKIVAIRQVSKDDYSIVGGYRAVQELTVGVAVGDGLDVPTIGKFEHKPEHDALGEAIANMHALSSYTLDMTQNLASVYATTPTVSGFVETITEDLCYFDPFTLPVNTALSDYVSSRKFSGDVYGYKQVAENLYNTFFYYGETDGYKATRAYAAPFANARPTFAFAPEIFTSWKENEDGSTTYYVNDNMLAVASTFYYGVGNDIALYGLFAARGWISSTEVILPYVKIDNNFIVEAGFYSYLGSIYGIIEIAYSDFNTATVPNAEDITFTTRQVPTLYSELEVDTREDSAVTGMEGLIDLDTYLSAMFGASYTDIPFFGDVLGDTFGLSYTAIHTPSGSNRARKAIIMYYDVPLDLDYTINSSLTLVQDQLVAAGFLKNKDGTYVKGDISIQPVDNNLDFIIYIWNNNL